MVKDNLITKKRQEGFTIIEVLIVLAIAGLIILIVFLAVPALQRNSRTTQRKNDVSAIMGALSEAVSNNNGNLPASCNGTATTCWVKDAKMTQFDGTTANVSYTKNTSATTATDLTEADADREKINIQSYQKCNGNAFTATGATSRSVAAEYLVEKSGGSWTRQCVES